MGGISPQVGRRQNIDSSLSYRDLLTPTALQLLKMGKYILRYYFTTFILSIESVSDGHIAYRGPCGSEKNRERPSLGLLLGRGPGAGATAAVSTDGRRIQGRGSSANPTGCFGERVGGGWEVARDLFRFCNLKMATGAVDGWSARASWLLELSALLKSHQYC